MGNKNTGGETLSDSDIRIFSQQTQLPPHIIQQLYEAFIERAGKNGRMSIMEFKNAYTEINPNANIFHIDNDAERIFMMFDRDRNGVLTFDEFMMAYILLQRGGDNLSNRWQNVINAMPPGMVSRPGFLNYAEALQLLQYMNQFYQIPNFDPAVNNNLLWSQLGSQVDPSGYISQEAFLRILSAQPQLQSHIW